MKLKRIILLYAIIITFFFPCFTLFWLKISQKCFLVAGEDWTQKKAVCVSAGWALTPCCKPQPPTMLPSGEVLMALMMNFTWPLFT